MRSLIVGMLAPLALAAAPVAAAASDQEGTTKVDEEAALEVTESTDTVQKPAKIVINPSAGVKMTFEQKLEVYNKALPKNERLYCRRDMVTGSHKKKVRCVTLAQKRDEEEAARKFLRAVR